MKEDKFNTYVHRIDLDNNLNPTKDYLEHHLLEFAKELLTAGVIKTTETLKYVDKDGYFVRLYIDAKKN